MRKVLLLLALMTAASLAGCRRFDARLDSLRDERVGEIERHLGVSEGPRDEPSPRELAMPAMPEADRR